MRSIVLAKPLKLLYIIIFFSFFLLFSASDVEAKTYYVSSTDGDDINCNGQSTDFYTGFSQECPWKTIYKFNSQTFNPGDTILFKSGDTWREEMAIPNAGDMSGKITISSYGTGNNPKILGSDMLSNWHFDNSQVISQSDFVSMSQFNSSATSGNVVSTTLSKIPTQGNLLVAVGWGTNSDANASILGWTKIVSSRFVGNSYMVMFYKTAGLNESNIVTLNWQGSAQTRLAVEEWSGLIDPLVEQVNNSNTSGLTTTSISSGIIENSTVGTKLLISAFGHGGPVSNRNYANLFTEDVDVNNSNTWQMSSRVVDGFGTFENSQTWTTARISGAFIVSFRSSQNIGKSGLYYSNLSTNPSDVWFVMNNGDVVNKNAKNSKLDLVEDGDWWYDSVNSRLYIYASDDPQISYQSVEVANPGRDRGIGWVQNRHGYVDVSNFEVAFVNGVGIVLRGNSNVNNNIVHHISSSSNHGYGIEINTGSNNVISNNIVYETGGASFYTTASYDDHVNSNITVERNTFYNAKTQLVLISTGSSGLFNENNIVRYNYLYHTPNFVPKIGQGNAISFQGRNGAVYKNSKAYYNSIAINSGAGIYVGDYVTNLEVANNTLSSKLGRGIFISGNGTNNISILNNIVVNAGINALRVVNRNSVLTADYNIYYSTGNIPYASIGSTSYLKNQFLNYKSATGWDTHSSWQDPQVVSVDDINFSLKSTSPAIDSGTLLNYYSDIKGVLVPQNNITDIGSSEYSNSNY